MFKAIADRIQTGIILTIVSCLMMIAFEGCKAPARTFKIGIATVEAHVTVKSQIINGFKAGMAELGHVEGEKIKYIHEQIPELNNQVIDTKIRGLLAQDIDLLLTLESEVAFRAKEIVDRTDIPVLFITNIKSFENSLVENIDHPGGNLTGVQFVNANSKALEWLTMTVPGAKKIYLPYNPDDIGVTAELAGLDKTASQLGIELVLDEIHSVEETIEDIENLPEDIDAIFRIPSPTLNERNMELSQAAMKKGIPIGASIRLNGDVLITLANDFYSTGKQAARLAHQIHQGIKPADLPVEASEALLTINLRTAEKIGIHVPDDIIAQAKTIIR